jgi:fimbrial chaperone protein
MVDIRRSVLPGLLIALASLWSGPPVQAGSFQVVPLYVYLEAGNPRATLTVSNTGEEELTVQLQAMRWSQDEQGRDRLEPTADLVFFPRLVKIGVGQERIVRLGLDKPRPAETETAYRLFIRELPVAKPGETVLRVAIEISLPVFVSVPKPRPQAAISSAQLRAGSALLQIRNSGNTHLLLKKIRVVGRGAEDREEFVQEGLGWYVLPGSERTFAVALPQDPCQRCSSLLVTIQSEEGSLERVIEVDPAQCLPPPAESPARS